MKLKEWRANGEEILLMGDFNQDIYDSTLAEQLTSEDIGLEEQFQKLHGTRAPFSHMMGKKPIMAVYATSGITVISYFLSKHHAMGSVGDHRLHVLDVCSKTITGRDTPQVTKIAKRRLQFRHHKSRKKYIKDSVKMVTKHKMCRKVRALQMMTPSANKARCKKGVNKFDDEHIAIETACEKKCRKIKNNTIAWFPLVTVYGKELRVYSGYRDTRKGSQQM